MPPARGTSRCPGDRCRPSRQHRPQGYARYPRQGCRWGPTGELPRCSDPSDAGLRARPTRCASVMHPPWRLRPARVRHRHGAIDSGESPRTWGEALPSIGKGAAATREPGLSEGTQGASGELDWFIGHSRAVRGAMNATVDTPIRQERARGIAKARAYLALTKPRVIELLLVTTAPVMILAQGGIPNLWLMLWTLVGGALSAGAAGAFNCYIDRDIDRVMARTSNRPLVTGALSDREALVFSWVLTFLSIGVLYFATNWLAAALSAAAIF